MMGRGITTSFFAKVLWSGVSVAAGALIAAFCLAKTSK